jgi:hypothetical protein
MIYGYDSRTINEYGLKQMREVSVSVDPDDLRALAEFLTDAADELEGGVSGHWHKHAPDSLRRRLGCDFIVLNTNEPDVSAQQRVSL